MLSRPHQKHRLKYLGHPMSLPTIFDTCHPRADALSGSVRDDEFMADLSGLINRTASAEYLDPATFFAKSYPTRGMKGLLKAVCVRLGTRIAIHCPTTTPTPNSATASPSSQTARNADGDLISQHVPTHARHASVFGAHHSQPLANSTDRRGFETDAAGLG